MFRLDSPATSERIRMACVDEFTKQVKKFIFCFYHQESELEAGGVENVFTSCHGGHFGVKKQ